MLQQIGIVVHGPTLTLIIGTELERRATRGVPPGSTWLRPMTERWKPKPDAPLDSGSISSPHQPAKEIQQLPLTATGSPTLPIAIVKPESEVT